LPFARRLLMVNVSAIMQKEKRGVKSLLIVDKKLVKK